MSAEGALLFARYAYPPNELGYCGPTGASTLLRPDAADEIEHRAREFEGAWCYLEFIAESTHIADPLDPRIVQAYWIGNELLDAVDPYALVDRLLDRFSDQRGGTWREASSHALAHHSFHVFEVYPWAGFIAVKGNPTAVSVLDGCRIRTGRVISVEGGSALVQSTHLRWDGIATVSGPQQVERVRWSSDGMALWDGPRTGDLVAIHFDWICEVLTDEQCRQIETLDAKQRARLKGFVAEQPIRSADGAD